MSGRGNDRFQANFDYCKAHKRQKRNHILNSDYAYLTGAGGRNRTDTGSPPLDFESSASTSFTTPAGKSVYSLHSAMQSSKSFETGSFALECYFCNSLQIALLPNTLDQRVRSLSLDPDLEDQ